MSSLRLGHAMSSVPTSSDSSLLLWIEILSRIFHCTCAFSRTWNCHHLWFGWQYGYAELVASIPRHEKFWSILEFSCFVGIFASQVCHFPKQIAVVAVSACNWFYGFPECHRLHTLCNGKRSKAIFSLSKGLSAHIRLCVSASFAWVRSASR